MTGRELDDNRTHLPSCTTLLRQVPRQNVSGIATDCPQSLRVRLRRMLACGAGGGATRARARAPRGRVFVAVSSRAPSVVHRRAYALVLRLHTLSGARPKADKADKLAKKNSKPKKLPKKDSKADKKEAAALAKKNSAKNVLPAARALSFPRCG